MPTFWTEIEHVGTGTNLVLHPTGVVVCSFATYWEANSARCRVRLVAAPCAYDALELARSRLEAAGLGGVN